MDSLDVAVATAQTLILKQIGDGREAAQTLRRERALAAEAASAAEAALKAARLEASETIHSELAALNAALLKAEERAGALDASLRTQRAVADAMVKNMQNEERETERLLADKTRECERRKREIASLLAERPGASVSTTPFRAINIVHGNSPVSAAGFEPAETETAKPRRPSPRRPSLRKSLVAERAADFTAVEALASAAVLQASPRKKSLASSPAASPAHPVLRRANGGSAKVPTSQDDWKQELEDEHFKASSESSPTFRVLSPDRKRRERQKQLSETSEVSKNNSLPWGDAFLVSPPKPRKLPDGPSSSAFSANAPAEGDFYITQTVDHLRERRAKLAERRAQAVMFA
jgi:hypothetical protein